MISSPQRSPLSPSPLSPRCCGRLVRIPQFIDVGVAVVEIFGEIVESWLAAEEEEELAGLARNPPS